MRTRQARAAGRWRGAAVLVVVLSGCAGGSGGELGRALLESRALVAANPDPTASYCVHCPDVMDVSVLGPRPWHRSCRVAADGCIDLGDAGRQRVEGQTTNEIARHMAGYLNAPLSQVHVAIAEFNSEQVYVHGGIHGAARAVPYRGPETVVQLLQRAGGLSADAAPRDIQVVRANVADGGAPEVYHVDLAAILVKNDQRTNVPLQPFDQVYVGQLRRSGLARALPPWLRSLAEALSGTAKGKDAPPPDSLPPPRPISIPAISPDGVPAPAPAPLRLAAP